MKSCILFNQKKEEIENAWNVYIAKVKRWDKAGEMEWKKNESKIPF